MRAFRLAYDGRPFHGFQRQPDVPTVEGALFSALRSLGACEDDPAGYSAAGRTDAGVSAAAQTVAFDAPDWCLPAALNSALPGSVRAWASAEVPSGFHATREARRRTYVYHLYAPDADPGLARKAARRLSGEHDFHNLTIDNRRTTRDLSVSVRPDGDYLLLRIAAGGFPRGLVRRIASLVSAVAAGATPMSKIERVLGPDSLDGAESVSGAPAYPLVLLDVKYDLAFEIDDGAARDAREAFEGRRVERGTLARVAREVRDRIEHPAGG